MISTDMIRKVFEKEIEQTSSELREARNRATRSKSLAEAAETVWREDRTRVADLEQKLEMQKTTAEEMLEELEDGA